MSSPKEIYGELLQVAPKVSGRAYRAFHGPNGLHVRAFVDGVTRLPGLALRMNRDRVPTGMSLPNIRGAKTAITQIDAGEQAKDVLYEFVASERAFAPVFVELASRLVADAVVAPSTEEALICVTRRLASWARFFDARGTEGLGRSAQLGLIGELLCLEQLGTMFGFDTAVKAWTGPTGATHDFQTRNGCIEVKLSTASSPERFRITSERQLDDSVVPWLGVFAIVAQETRSGDTGIPVLVSRIRELIESNSPAARALFEERLLETGYSDADLEIYDVRITIKIMEIVEVTAEFPRITPSELRPGVFSVSYDIPWTAVAPYRIEHSEFRRIFSVGE